MTLLSKLITRIQHSAIAKDSSWAVIGSAVGKGASMLTGMIIARLLGAEDFGEYGMIKSTLAYIAVFSTFGLGYTATKYIAQYQDRPNRVIGIIRNSIAITFAVSGLMALLLLIFAEYIIKEPSLAPTLRHTALIVIFNAVNTTQLGLLSGFKDFKTVAINNAITGIATVLLGTTLTYFKGIDGAIFTLFVTTALQCILNHVAIRRHAHQIRQEAKCASEDDKSKDSAWELIRFSLPIALQESVYASANWIKMLILVHLAGYEELGLYTATNQCHQFIIFIPNVLRNVILSHLSSSLNDNARHKQTFSTMIKINLFATMLPALGVALFSPIIEQIYGDSFVGLAHVIIITAISSIFESLSDIYVQEFISRGYNWITLLGYIVRNYGSILIALPLLLKFRNSYGALMAFIAILISQIIYCIMLHVLYRYKIQTKHNN